MTTMATLFQSMGRASLARSWRLSQTKLLRNLASHSIRRCQKLWATLLRRSLSVRVQDSQPVVVWMLSNRGNHQCLRMPLRWPRKNRISSLRLSNRHSHHRSSTTGPVTKHLSPTLTRWTSKAQIKTPCLQTSRKCDVTSTVCLRLRPLMEHWQILSVSVKSSNKTLSCWVLSQRRSRALNNRLTSSK